MHVDVTKEGLMEAASKAISLDALQTKVTIIIDMILKKNAEYGDAWQEFNIFVPLIRIREKMIRLENLADDRPALVYSYQIADELDDIIAYALLAKLWLGSTFEEEVQQIIKMLRDDYESEQKPDKWGQMPDMEAAITTGHKHCERAKMFNFIIQGDMASEQTEQMIQIIKDVVEGMGLTVKFE